MLDFDLAEVLMNGPCKKLDMFALPQSTMISNSNDGNLNPILNPKRSALTPPEAALAYWGLGFRLEGSWI